MKKWLPVLIIFFLVACGNNNDEAYNNNKQSDQPVEIRLIRKMTQPGKKVKKSQNI